MLPHRYRVVKYTQAQRCGEVDDWTSVRDIGAEFAGVVLTDAEYQRVEQSYVDAMLAFAADCGVRTFQVRDPALARRLNFTAGPILDDNGLTGVFEPPHHGFHDGAEVSVPVAAQLLRVMLRESGAWCRLEAPGRMYVHVGHDYYCYLGTGPHCPGALARVAELGLHADECTSPYDPELDEPIQPVPADQHFWRTALARTPALLWERWCGGGIRWHWLTPDTVAAVRARLLPRAQLVVYPADLVLPPERAVELAVRAWQQQPWTQLVWRTPDGEWHDEQVLEPEEFPLLAPRLATATAAVVLPPPGPQPTGYLPDADGVVRARAWADTPDFGYRVGAEVAPEAVRAFAAEAGVAVLEVREPEFRGAAPDPALHDGAVLGVADAVELVRRMVTDGGVRCRLELRDDFTVHIGLDGWCHLGSSTPCPLARDRFGAIEGPAPSVSSTVVEYRTADETFWREVADLPGPVVLEERWARGASRLHHALPADLLPRSVVQARGGGRVLVAAVPDPDGLVRLRHVPREDEVCAFAGCHRPAAGTYLDHTVAWDSAEPGEYCHTHPPAGWTAEEREPGTWYWTSPTGDTYTESH